MGEWFLVTLRFAPAEKETVWTSLYKFDCIGLEETGAGICRAYFPAGIDLQPVLISLRACPAVHSAEASIVPAREWNALWMESYQSFPVASFFIRPSWRRDIPEPGSVEIVMDPRGAFGSGTHATTQLCLKRLPDLIGGKRTMIDIGCGSGILSIAARKISPQMRIVALDHDLEACLVCRENAVINNVSFPIVCGTFAALQYCRADLIVANLQLDQLVRLKPEFHSRTLPETTLLLSGILEEQVTQCRQAYEPSFRLRELNSQDGWVAALYQRK